MPCLWRIKWLWCWTRYGCVFPDAWNQKTVLAPGSTTHWCQSFWKVAKSFLYKVREEVGYLEKWPIFLQLSRERNIRNDLLSSDPQGSLKRYWTSSILIRTNPLRWKSMLLFFMNRFSSLYTVGLHVFVDFSIIPNLIYLYCNTSPANLSFFTDNDVFRISAF